MADQNCIKEEIEALSCITDACEAGTTRIGFSESYRKGVEYMKKRMEQAGLEAREDSIGNIYGLLRGENPQLPAIVSGSHLDTVRCAGAFDGIAGVVCALEVARMLQKNDVKLQHDFEVLGLIEEEGTRFGQVLLGSQFITGDFGEKQLDSVVDSDGESLRQVLSSYQSKEFCPALREQGEIKAFLELHDEQGPVLEQQGIDIGIVENIVAISWLRVTVEGFAGHAGTVPMLMRQDAGAGAFKLADLINSFTKANYAETATATIGNIELLPGSTNCVPSRCSFTVDLRSGQLESVQSLTDYIISVAKMVEQEFNVSIDVCVNSLKPSIQMDRSLQLMFEESCKKANCSYRYINSGAGHDAMVMSKKWRSAMIFVPCVKGITHNPEEFVHWDALARGTDVLYQTVVALDGCALE